MELLPSGSVSVLPTETTETATNPDPAKNTASVMDVTITAGLEKLASLSGSSLSSGTATSSETSGTESQRATLTGTSSSSSATASHTGAAGKVVVSNGAVGVVGMMAGLLVL